MATIKRFQAPIRISSKSNEIPLKSGYCIARSLPGEYRHKLEEDQHESKRGKPCIIVAASRKPNAQGLPDANPLPRHDKDELHEDNNSSQGGDNVQKEPSDGDLRNPATELDSNSNDQNRYLEVEPPVREDRSQKANPIYSDAAPDHQSHWQYSDTASKSLGQCLDADSKYQGQRLDGTSGSNFAASNSSSHSTAFNADLVSDFNLFIRLKFYFKIPTIDLFTGADNPDGKKTRLEEYLLPCNVPCSDNIRKPTIIIGFYHKYVRMKYLLVMYRKPFPCFPFSFFCTIRIVGTEDICSSLSSPHLNYSFRLTFLIYVLLFSYLIFLHSCIAFASFVKPPSNF